jgi:hypothetical protein
MNDSGSRSVTAIICPAFNRIGMPFWRASTTKMVNASSGCSVPPVLRPTNGNGAPRTWELRLTSIAEMRAS